MQKKNNDALHTELSDIPSDQNQDGAKSEGECEDRDEDEDENHLETKLRPWESFEKRGLQTRTIAAREAVKKAQTIVKRNQTFSADLRKRFADIYNHTQRKH